MSPDEARDRILEEMLGNVVFDGWTERAMRDSAGMAGLDAAALARAFPDGLPDMMRHFGRWTDRQMLAALEDDWEGFRELTVPQRIRRCVVARLEILAPHKEAVRRLTALLALPPYAGLAARMAYDTVDTIWRAVGDDATDFSFYTKRATLAGLLGAVTLYWLNDQSEEHEATIAFLDRRLSDVAATGRAARRLGRLGDVAELPFRAAARARDLADRLRRTVGPSGEPR
jgi:ubiquinone biosynthesis protein COQ9